VVAGKAQDKELLFDYAGMVVDFTQDIPDSVNPEGILPLIQERKTVDVIEEPEGISVQN
jgi:hypothetical protein